MGIGKSLVGTCVVEITSAAIAQTLTALNDIGIRLNQISYCDELHIRAEVYALAFPKLQLYLSQHGCDIRIIKRKGLFWPTIGLKRRLILVLGIIVMFLLSLYLPTRIFFVEVEGNEKVPTQRIIEKAESCGIGFGSSRRKIRSEKVKNALLSLIPDLQWAGVNTAGCVAVISVRERTEDTPQNKIAQASSIVAARDGIIKELVVTQGNPLCKVGQAVKKGQVLVSGYTDCGLLIKMTASEAEITAQTQRNLNAVTPVEYQVRGKPVSEKRQYRLRIGKNIINLSKYSGISDTGCVKMYEEKFMMLPGGYRLPVCLITERTLYYGSTTASTEDSGDLNWLDRSSDAYLQSQMQSGTILNSERTSDLSDGLYCLKSVYSCNEMIGAVREEGFVSYNGKTD